MIHKSPRFEVTRGVWLHCEDEGAAGPADLLGVPEPEQRRTPSFPAFVATTASGEEVDRVSLNGLRMSELNDWLKRLVRDNEELLRAVLTEFGVEEHEGVVVPLPYSPKA